MTYDFSSRIFHDRYALIRQIGVGGMATVYEATDQQLDKRVAVKVLNPDLAQDKSQVDRFRQEARSAVKLQHDHLVDVTDQNVTPDGLPYFVMEYLDGYSLGDLIHDHDGPMPWERVVDLVLQICEALAVAHDRGIIHRDVKPGNCFITQRKGVDFLKVLDLGIAKLLPHARDPSTPPSTRASQGVAGTPEYMAPELARGEPHDHRVDIYAIGIMLYRLLTGLLPFFSPHSPYATLEMHCTRLPTPLRLAAPNAGIPPSIEEITLRALAKAPDERWGSTHELADALRRARDVELFYRERSQGREATAQYLQPNGRRSRARTLHLIICVLGGLAASGTMFMVMMLIDLRGTPLVAAPYGSDGKHATIVVAEPKDSPKVARAPATPTGSEKPPEPLLPTLVDPPVAPTPVRVVPSPAVPAPKPVAKTPMKVAGPKVRTPQESVRQQIRAFEKKIASACKPLLDPLDPFRNLKIELELDPWGAVTVFPQPPDANSNLGRCVKTELEKQTFRPVTGLSGRASAAIKIQR